MKKLSDIKTTINKYATLGTPFLVAIDFELSEAMVIKNPLEQSKVLFKTPLASNLGETINLDPAKNKITPHPESFLEYQMRFNTIMHSFKISDAFVANLTLKTPIEIDASLEEIFMASTAPYSLYVPDRFVCFSPERFIKIANGTISTNPMKGTINAAIPNAKELILSNEKEIEEHDGIIGLVKDDLSKVADNVSVKRYRYIDEISTGQRKVLQVSSEITGLIKTDYSSSLGSIIFDLLPAGSISGAPKQSALEAIRKAEKQPRGFYTGIFGYFDGTDFDSAVMIRFIEKEGDKTYFRSGGGLTIQSDVESEYNEVIEKIYLPFS